MKTGNYVHFIFALSKIVDDSISTHPRCEAQSQMESGNVRATGTLRRPMGTRGNQQCNAVSWRTMRGPVEGVGGNQHCTVYCVVPW